MCSHRFSNPSRQGRRRRGSRLPRPARRSPACSSTAPGARSSSPSRRRRAHAHRRALARVHRSPGPPVRAGCSDGGARAGLVSAVLSREPRTSTSACSCRTRRGNAAPSSSGWSRRSACRRSSRCRPRWTTARSSRCGGRGSSRAALGAPDGLGSRPSPSPVTSRSGVTNGGSFLQAIEVAADGHGFERSMRSRILSRDVHADEEGNLDRPGPATKPRASPG